MRLLDRFKKKDKKSPINEYGATSEEMSIDERDTLDIVDEGQQLLNKYIANYEECQKGTEKARESLTALDKGLDNLRNNRANNNPFRAPQQEMTARIYNEVNREETPEEHLEKIMAEMKELGFLEDDIIKKRKGGLELINAERRAGKTEQQIKELMDGDFKWLKNPSSVEDTMKYYSEERNKTDNDLAKLLVDLQSKGFSEDEIKELLEIGMKIIADGRKKGEKEIDISIYVGRSVSKLAEQLAKQKKSSPLSPSSAPIK